MTVAIKESLTILNQYIEDLEQKAQDAQSKAEQAINSARQAPQSSPPKKAGAPDLFSVPTGADVDAKALASRLDGAIAKVEKLLKEEA